ncbi:MAG: hypothetical protein AAF567_13275 [Actinomycetota bacterium]
MLVVGASAHGSPGVSTALQLVAAQWPDDGRTPIVVEADLAGGVLAARFEISLTPGMVTLAEALRQGEHPDLLMHAQRLPSGVACVPSSPSATAAATQLRSAGAGFGRFLRSSGHPVLVDTGTMLPDHRVDAVTSTADLVLWFVRPIREELLVLRTRIEEMAQFSDAAIVLIGESPHDARQVESALKMPVLQVLPDDDRAARAANRGGDDRYLRRSPLARSSAQLADRLHDRASRRVVEQITSDQPTSSSEPERAPSESRPEPLVVSVGPASAPSRPVEPAPSEASHDVEDKLVVWLPDGG